MVPNECDLNGIVYHQSKPHLLPFSIVKNDPSQTSTSCLKRRGMFLISFLFCSLDMASSLNVSRVEQCSIQQNEVLRQNAALSFPIEIVR